MSEPSKKDTNRQRLPIYAHLGIPVGSLTLVDLILSDVYRLVAEMLKDRIRSSGADLDHLGRRRRPGRGEPTTRLVRRPLGEGT